MNLEKVNIKDKFRLFNEHWTPKIVGELNGQQVKLAKLKGEFVWHDHKEEDEMFLVIKGSLRLEFRDKTITLNEGEMYIVPGGVEYNPVALEVAWGLLFEAPGTKHIREPKDNLTIKNPGWICL